MWRLTDSCGCSILPSIGPLGGFADGSNPMEYPCEFFARDPARRLRSRFTGMSPGMINYGNRGSKNRHRRAGSIGRDHVRRRLGSFRPRPPTSCVPILSRSPMSPDMEDRLGKRARLICEVGSAPVKLPRPSLRAAVSLRYGIHGRYVRAEMALGGKYNRSYAFYTANTSR